MLKSKITSTMFFFASESGKKESRSVVKKSKQAGQSSLK